MAWLLTLDFGVRRPHAQGMSDSGSAPASVTESSMALSPETGAAMPGTPVVLTCQKCSTPMVLTQNSPGERGFDNRVFDCLKCGHSEVLVVKEL
jgi:hypothetical protein